MSLRIGIDIGSTTVKVVVLDEQNKLLFRSYERHYSKTRERTCQTLQGLRGMLGGQEIKLSITGSAGLGVAKAANLDFVQEVYATAAAVRQFIPQTDAVIELGGEDAKIIYFDNGIEQRMNGTCAGGTGAFIDQMATLLHTDASGLNELAANATTIYPIASRCGVFAKTDVQPLLNEGIPTTDLALSALHAVARDGYLHAGQHAVAQRSAPPVDPDAALLNPAVGLAARALARVRQILVQAYAFFVFHGAFLPSLAVSGNGSVFSLGNQRLIGDDAHRAA